MTLDLDLPAWLSIYYHGFILPEKLLFQVGNAIHPVLFSLGIVQVYILMLFAFSLVLKVRLLSESYYKTFQEKDLTRSKVEDYDFFGNHVYRVVCREFGNMFTIASSNFCI